MSGKKLAKGVERSMAVTSRQSAGHVRQEGGVSGQHTTGLEEKIRNKAYELFVLEGGRHGNDLAHWFKAENEIKEHKDVSMRR